MSIDIETVLLWIGLGLGLYLAFRRKLSRFRRFIDAVDDALYDDRVTEAEFRRIWNTGSDVFRSR